MSAQYLHDLGDDVLALRRPAEERYRRGALWAFGVPLGLLSLGWLGFWLFVEPSAASVALAALALGLPAALSAIVGMVTLLAAAKGAGREEARIDLAERLIERPGRAAEVFRRPDAVVLRRRRLGWELGLRSEHGVDALLRVPRAMGHAAARAAEELGERLDVKVEVAPGARRASGLIPARDEALAALIWSPLDGANLAYAFWALWTSDDEGLRRQARQSLGHLALEALGLGGLALLLGGPTWLFGAPPAVVLLFFLLPTGVLYALRVGLRGWVAYRAYAGEPWPAPWMSWLRSRPKPRPPSAPASSTPALSTPTPAPRRYSPITQVGGPW